MEHEDGHRRPSDVTRREFLKKTACVSAGLAFSAAAAKEELRASTGELPKRVLGRTKEKVTILGLDTARGYGNAEEALGHLVPKRRDKLFLVTKVWTDSAAGAEKSLTRSLRLLKVDHVDLVHIHHIGGKDVDNRPLSKEERKMLLEHGKELAARIGPRYGPTA